MSIHDPTRRPHPTAHDVPRASAGPVRPEEQTDVLTDRSARILAAHRLLRRTRRLESGQFLADGAQAVREAVGIGPGGAVAAVELFVTARAAERNIAIVRAALRAGITVTEVTDRAAAKLSDALTPQGITALCRLPDGARAGAADAEFDRILAAGPRLLAVLVETSDPGNAGTIVRLADAAGADAVVVAGDAVDPWGPKAVRGSVGSIFHLPVVRLPDPASTLTRLAAAGLATLATAGAAELTLPEADGAGLLAEPSAWLFGSEAHGLPEEVIAGATRAVRIPIYGRAESLNLATAAALCLYASAAAQRR